MKAIDLFCGAGGASLGMHQGGVEVVAGVDQNERALTTHAENLPGEHIQHDLSDVDPTVLPTTDVDWVHGSPPCKGFSHAQGERDIEDDRNALVWRFIDWVDAIDPAIVTMENVTGMANISDEWMDEVISAFHDIGYEARWRELNAADYGVPQMRRRVYVVAIAHDHPKPSEWFPTPTHAEDGQATLDDDALLPWKTAGDAIADLTDASDNPPIEAADAPNAGIITDGSGMPNHVAPNHRDSTREKLGEYTKGKTHGRTTACRLHRNKTAFTVSYSNATPHVHYQDEPVRRLTVRECARLQSFPDDFVFYGPRTHQYKQVGNAVPPKLQQHLARKVRAIISRAE